MLPTERRQVLQQRVINGMAVATQRVRSPFQIDRVPQHDGSRYQIEAASPVALLLETAVADFTQAVEKHCPGQRIARLALVQAGMHAAAQFHALQPVQMNSVRSMRPSSRSATASRSGVGSCRAFGASGRPSPCPA